MVARLIILIIYCILVHFNLHNEKKYFKFNTWQVMQRCQKVDYVWIFSKKYILIDILKPTQLFLYLKSIFMNFLVLIRRIEEFYFLILMFKLQISHIKQIFMILWICFLEKSENFPKKAMYCAYMNNALLMSYKSLKIGRKCKKCCNHQLFDPLLLKYYVKKKICKIQAHSWDCYWAIEVVKAETNFLNGRSYNEPAIYIFIIEVYSRSIWDREYYKITKK